MCHFCSLSLSKRTRQVCLQQKYQLLYQGCVTKMCYFVHSNRVALLNELAYRSRISYNPNICDPVYCVYRTIPINIHWIIVDEQLPLIEVRSSALAYNDDPKSNTWPMNLTVIAIPRWAVVMSSTGYVCQTSLCSKVTRRVKANGQTEGQTDGQSRLHYPPR